jgi:glycosyltransferase involved in cell wall biosynthesis
MKNKKKILLIGPWPPPAGGVSVHLQRLLNKNESFELAVLDWHKKKLFQKGLVSGIFQSIKYFFASDLVHFHVTRFFAILLMIIVKLTGKKIVYSIHNLRKRKSCFQKIMRFLSDKIIYVSSPGRLQSNEVVIPAYISSEENTPVNNDLMDKINTAAFVSVTCCNVNEPFLYGLDIIQNAFLKLDVENKFLVIVQTGAGVQTSKFVFENNIQLVAEDIALNSLLQKADVFLRATRDDGDSLSVREALENGNTVIASDCVTRPEGCILFRSGDSADLLEKLENSVRHPIRQQYRQPDYSDNIFHLYHELLSVNN